MKKLSFTLLFTLLFVGAFAQSNTQTDEDVRYNQYGTRVDRIPLESEARDGILVFENAKKNFRFWFDIRVQFDGALFFGEKEYMDPIGNNVSIRRARFAIKSQISRNWYGEIDTDFSNGEFELKDAMIRYNRCSWEFSLGNFKEDFSMEQITSSRYLPFMERPMVVSAFAPSRHVGLDVKYRQDWLYASAGAFFQVIDGAETASWISDANKDNGYNQGVSFTGRVVFNPFFKDAWRGLHIAGGASYRTPKTDSDPREYHGFRYSARNSTSINRKKYLDTGRHLGVTDYEFLWNAELAGHYKGVRLQAEYIGMNNYLKKNQAGMYSGIDKYTFGGWYAMAGFMLFGGEQRYNMGDAKFTQPTRGRNWGDLELLLRYDYLDLNSKNVYGGTGQNFTAGLNYYINENVKFVLNYQYSDNDRYANGKADATGKGDFKIGVDAAGKPTNNFTSVVADKGKAGVKYHMLGLRMEIDF